MAAKLLLQRHSSRTLSSSSARGPLGHSLDCGGEFRGAELHQVGGRRLSIGRPPQHHGHKHHFAVTALEEARPQALGRLGVEHVPDRKIAKQPIASAIRTSALSSRVRSTEKKFCQYGCGNRSLRWSTPSLTGRTTFPPTGSAPS